jgi:hypothetical protein
VVVGPKRVQVTGEIGRLLVLVFLIPYIWLFIDLLNSRLLCVFFLVTTIKIHFIKINSCTYFKTLFHIHIKTLKLVKNVL